MSEHFPGDLAPLKTEPGASMRTRMVRFRGRLSGCIDAGLFASQAEQINLTWVSVATWERAGEGWPRVRVRVGRRPRGEAAPMLPMLSERRVIRRFRPVAESRHLLKTPIER